MHEARPALFLHSESRQDICLGLSVLILALDLLALAYFKIWHCNKNA